MEIQPKKTLEVKKSFKQMRKHWQNKKIIRKLRKQSLREKKSKERL